MILKDALRNKAVEQLQALMTLLLIFFEELVPDSYCLLCPQLFLFIVSISLRAQFFLCPLSQSETGHQNLNLGIFSRIFHWK